MISLNPYINRKQYEYDIVLVTKYIIKEIIKRTDEGKKCSCLENRPIRLVE